jgi:hypothetical protein
MTAKQAIKARCKDCLAGSRECTFTDCALKGLAKAKRGSDRNTAIKKYCQWCMNGHPVSLCTSPDCGIYQYRANHKGYLKIDFKPVNPHNMSCAEVSE